MSSVTQIILPSPPVAGGGGSAITDDPFSAYTSYIALAGYGGSAGSSTTQSWGSGSVTGPTYSTIQAAINAGLTTGGRRVCVIGSHTVTADVTITNSGSNDSTRVVLQGPPGSSPSAVVDLNSAYGIKVDASYVTIRCLEVTGQDKTSGDGNANPGPIYFGASSVYNGAVVEYCYVHDNWVDSGAYDTGCVTLGPQVLSVGATVRYNKFKNYGIPPSNFTNGNVCGVYAGASANAQIYNNEMDNTSVGFFEKHGDTTQSPNGSTCRRNIVKNCYQGFQYLGAGISSSKPLFGVEISNNLIYSTNQNAILMAQVAGGLQCSDVLIANNTTDTCDIWLQLDGFQNVAIRNNATISAATYLAAILQDSTALTRIASCNYDAWSTGGWLIRRGSSLNFANLAAWRTAYSTGSASPQLAADPDALLSAVITSSAFTNAAGRNYVPAGGSVLLSAGSDGKHIGCYDGTNTIGPGW